MDEDKSREYRELVEKVKLKYRENPICKGNLRLGWCDLVPGEDLLAFAIREILSYLRIMVWLLWHLEKAHMQSISQENGTQMTI